MIALEEITDTVSVPSRGYFFPILTDTEMIDLEELTVSVPSRGYFFPIIGSDAIYRLNKDGFPSPLGVIFFRF